MDYLKQYLYTQETSETKLVPFKLCSRLNIDCYKKHSLNDLSNSIHVYAKNQELFVDNETSIVMDDLLKEQLALDSNIKIAVPYFNNNLLNKLWESFN